MIFITLPSLLLILCMPRANHSYGTSSSLPPPPPTHPPTQETGQRDKREEGRERKEEGRLCRDIFSDMHKSPDQHHFTAISLWPDIMHCCLLFSVDTFRDFLKNYFEGNVEPFIKSEEVPETNDGPVTVGCGFCWYQFPCQIINNHSPKRKWVVLVDIHC